MSTEKPRPRTTMEILEAGGSQTVAQMKHREERHEDPEVAAAVDRAAEAARGAIEAGYRVEPPVVKADFPGSPVHHNVGERQQPQAPTPPPVPLNTGRVNVFAGLAEAEGWTLLQRAGDARAMKYVYAREIAGLGVVLNIVTRAVGPNTAMAESACFVPGARISPDKTWIQPAAE